MFSFWRRKRRRESAGGSSAPDSPGAIAELNKACSDSFKDGALPCSKCGFAIPLEGLKPLRMVECPECEMVSFVPMEIGRYWLIEPLGGGGMGSVYKALNVEILEQYFAVKVLSRFEKTKPHNIHSLLNEARIGKEIGDHQCLVKCLDSGCESDEYYAAMELADGERLDKRIERLGRIPEDEALQITLHLLAAEQHIYKCGYLYRDMKPENIIVSNDGYGILFDYGLCLPREEALDPQEDEYVSGSPYYLPPERLLGTGEDAYSEIYSLGMVLYYAITGQTYFDATEGESLAKRHVSKVRLSVSSKLRDVRKEMADLLSKMIRPEPAERFQSFHEVADVVREILKG